MTKSESHLPHVFFIAALFSTFLTAASGAAAQGQEIVYSVDSWPRISTRADGKLTALSVSFGTQVPRAGPGAGGVATADDIVLTIPAGDAVALWWKDAVTRKSRVRVLIEFAVVGPKPAARAPFAVRLSDVIVNSVQVSKSRGDSGPGIAEVKLQAIAYEIFRSKQDATGAVNPGMQVNWNYAKNKE